MTKTKLQKHTLKKEDLVLSFECKSCLEYNNLNFNEADFYGGEQECYMCGSHGDVNVGFSCKHCGQAYDVELDSW